MECQVPEGVIMSAETIVAISSIVYLVIGFIIMIGVVRRMAIEDLKPQEDNTKPRTLDALDYFAYAMLVVFGTPLWGFAFIVAVGWALGRLILWGVE